MKRLLVICHYGSNHWITSTKRDWIGLKAEASADEDELVPQRSQMMKLILRILYNDEVQEYEEEEEKEEETSDFLANFQKMEKSEEQEDFQTIN